MLAYTTGGFADCDDYYTVDTTEDAWPRWGYWYSEGLESGDTEQTNGDLRIDVWDSCLDGNLATDW